MTRKRTDILNQTEAAAYISEHYEPMDPASLSRLTKHGGGPEFEKKGNQKLFWREDVDEWIEEQRTQGEDE